ncbi:hypothetical protein EVJ50_03965 [Synechococcus sp. RSCCF101]|uniref:hypothetical protein n=1 Tax=Synechococcus sp. RSCCF101 TaxID=2511069 RepID=UPI00124435CE|nr:hypothetical protein [Synechococcus sp. RSCCF101]QEY31533.1 hypothetical protein EVJ50_03965 [Synechococcus sp. RSCCF101]
MARAAACYPMAFEGSFSEFKERQLVFQLARQLVEAQFIRADRHRTERLWQEVAAEGMDTDRVIALLYGVSDHDDDAAMEAVDRPYRDQCRRRARRQHSPLARLATFVRRSAAPARHSAGAPLAAI